MPPTTTRDRELAQAWCDGDAHAGEELFERHYARVARFFRTKVGDAWTDLVQRTFLALVEGRDRLRDAASFRSYLFTVAHNQLYRHYRQQGRLVATDDLTSVADTGAPSPVSFAEHERQRRALLEALRRLPLDHQIALELHFWEDMSGTEIAEVLGIPLGTAKTRLRQARLRLEQILRELIDSPEQLESTLSDLEGWARRLRARLDDSLT